MKVSDVVFHITLAFLSCFCTCRFVCKQGKEQRRDRANFMDFESLGRHPDTTVKIYLSIQKQAKGKQSQEGSMRLYRGICALTFIQSFWQRQQQGRLW